MQRKIFQINKKIFDFLIIIIKDYSEYTIHISIFLLYIDIYKTIIVYNRIRQLWSDKHFLSNEQALSVGWTSTINYSRSDKSWPDE